jgi:hypothetical protein
MYQKTNNAIRVKLLELPRIRPANPPEPEPTDSAMMPLVQVLAKTFVQWQRASSRARTELTITVFRALHDSSPNRGQPITLPRLALAAPQKTQPINYNPLSRGKFMANLTGLASFVSELRVVRTNLANQLKHVDAALSVLDKLHGGSSYTKPGHTVSASARKRMSLAQKARWAKAKGHAPKPKRKISAAGRKRIAAAQRARWAKVRAGRKKK